MRRRSAGEIRRQDIIEDLDRLPKLTEDFQHPCPRCETQATILAAAPIPRTRCPGCSQELRLDKRIGGQLCLLPMNTDAEKASILDIERFRQRWARLLYFGVAALLIIGFALLLYLRSPFSLLFVGALLAITVTAWRNKREDERQRGARTRKKKRAHRGRREAQKRRRRRGELPSRNRRNDAP